MKIRLLITAVIPLLLLGCDMNDLFDKGDVEREYDGPPVVALFPLQQEVSAEAGVAAVEVQLIGEQRGSDLEASFSVNEEASTAEAGEHYNMASGSPVTIEAGESTADVVIELLEVAAGEEVMLVLDLEGASDGVEASENLKQATLFITE